MNQNLYRTVFSKALGMLVPVAEIARTQGKGAGRARGVAGGPTPGGFSAVASAVFAALWSVPALATPTLPTGGNITGGTGTISQSGSTLTVNQTSDKLSANWQSFDIGAGHGVVFNQPGRASVALNRVIGPDASRIYGSLTANGHVFLVNPNGVLFAPGAQVNVGGLAASTLDISEQDFASGRYRFTRGAGAGSVVNEGRIDAGSVVLIGPKVVNSGTISTPGGRTTLAAGEQVTVSMLDGLLSAQVDASVANAEIQNHGSILANGGRVDLVAGRADTVLNSLINTDGVIQARSVREQNGRIFLDGGAGGTVTVSGTLDASAPQAGRGGEVRVLGDQVTLASGARVDVSGQLSGGTALIGGDFQGKNAAVLNASRTTVEQGAAIQADGAEQGGRVIVWSDGATRYAGSISARGKGFAEVSGKGTLQFSGAVDTGGGTLLLDPTDITVQGTAGDGTNTFSGAQIATLLGSNDVVLHADNNVTWNSGVTLDYNGVGTRTLTLQAGNDINYRGTIRDSIAGGDQLSVIFNADRDANGTGAINIPAGASIATSGGDIVLRGGNAALTPLPAFTDPGYEAALSSTAARRISIGLAVLDAGGGNITMRGEGASSSAAAGVLLNNARIRTIGSGSITIDGLGASTSTGGGYGVQLTNSSPMISTVDGTLTVQGIGRGTGTENSGVRLNNGTVEATGSGNLILNGLGSTGGDFNDGVVADASTLRVSNGNMSITGTGRGTGLGSDGIELANSSIVEATGTGSVTLIGTSTATGANTNRGVTVWLGSTARTASGALTLQGSSADATKGDAISLESSGTIGGASQAGAITLTGDTVNLASGAVRGTGALLLQPLTPSATIGLGDGAAGTFNLGSGEIALLQDGFSSITVGRADGSGAVDVRTAAFTDPVTLRTPAGSGSIAVNGTLSTGTGTSLGSITLQAGGDVSLNNGTIDTSDALSITGGSYTATGASTLKSNTLAFGNTNAITGSGTLTFNQTADTTLANVIGGNASLVKAGANTLTLTGDNTYSGTTTVSAGTLQAGNGGTAGALGTGAVTIASGANLAFDRSDTVTVANAIDGAGSLTQAGTGTTILTANNTYSGGTTVNAGMLQAGMGGTTGRPGTGAVTVNAGGTLRFFLTGVPTITNQISGTGTLSLLGSGARQQSDYRLAGNNSGFTGNVVIDKARLYYDDANDVGAAAHITVLSGGQVYVLPGRTLPNALTLNGDGWLENAGLLGALRLQDSTASGNITLQSDSRITSFTQTGTVSGVISGNANLNKAFSGSLTFTGNNTYTGTTTVSGGTLQVGNGGTSGSLGGGAVTIASGATLAFNRSDTITVANAIGGAGNLTQAGAGTTVLTADNTYGGTTTVSAGTLQAGNGGTSGTIGTGAVTIASGADLVFDRSDTVTVGGAIGGAGNLWQAGTGTTILTANNTYSGSTTVSAGTLQVGAGGTTGRLGTSAVTVNAAGTLRYFHSDALGILNDISGTGTLEFLGTGVSGNSDYVLMGNGSGFAGTVNIDRARVQYNSTDDLGAGATINVLSGGQLLASANLSNAMNLNGTGWLHPAGTLGALRLSSGAVASGNIVLQSDASIGAYGSSGTISGVISGAGRALQIDRGTVTLSAAETFTGPLTIKSGSTLVLAPGASLATDSIRIGDISLGGSGGTVLQHQADNQLSPNAVVTFDAVGGQYSYWQLLGTNQSVAGIMDSTSNGVIENAETQDGFGNGTLTLTGAGSYSFGGYLRDKWSGTSGTLSIVKTGTGTQALVGGRVNYTGPTTVDNGTFVLNTTPAYASATTVNAGATLELAGNANVNYLAGFSLALNDGSRLLKTNSGYDTFNSSNVTVNGTVDVEIANSGVNNQLFIGGAGTGLQGSGTINLTHTGAATTGLSLRTGPGNFSGTINVDGGVLNIGSGASLALQNTDLNLTGTAKLNLAGAYAAGASPASVKSLTGASTSTVTLGGQTLTVGTNNGTGGDFAGVISGSGALAKTGTGTQILSGDNTYTGTTTISGGVLQIGNGGATGTLGTGAVTNNGSLVFDRSGVLQVANAIGGSGSLTQAGPGTVVLTGNNTYAGTTTVAAGTLQVGNDGTTGTLGTGAVTNNANLVFNRSNSTSLGVLAAGGITGTGNVSALIGGGFNVDRTIALTGASSSILLKAGKNQPAGTTAGGDVTLASNVSTSAGGTITIFSGNATTAAYEAMVGGASGATRYKTYNASAADTAGAVAGTRNYYYRQAPAALSVSGLAASKVYDGLRDAPTVDTTAAVVNGLIDGDSLASGALNVTGARFDSAHAGARTLGASVSSAAGPSYSGGGATWSVSGYSTAGMTGSGTGTITPRQVTTGINAVGKTYDGQTSTSSTLGAVTGFAGGDSATGVSGLQLAFDNPNAGVRNVVANGTGTLTGFTGAARGDGSGIGAGNEVAGLASDYAFVAPAPASATITPASLTVRANNDAKIVTQADTAGYNGVSFTGFVNGESAANLGGALAIHRSNAGTEAAGDYAGVLVPSGYTSGNYTISYQAGDFRILPAQQLLVRIQNVDNVYGTTPGYTVTSAQYMAADGTTLHTLMQTARTGNTYTYSDGAGGSVTFTVMPQGAATSGAGHLVVGNYGLAGSNATITGSNFTGLNYVGNQAVNRAALTPLAGGVSKVYDGTTAMTGLTLGLGGLLAGDAVNASGTGAFASRNAGTNLTYYVDGLALSGADAANYYLTAGSLTGNDGTITPRAITVSAVPATKVYDGNTSAPGTPLVNGSLVGGDSFTRLAQQFASPGVGTNLRLIPTALIEDGNGGANYLLTFVESWQGQVLAAPATQVPPLADASLPSQAPVAAALHRGESTDGGTQGWRERPVEEERLRRQVQVISTGLRLPPGLGASPLDDFERPVK